MMTMKTDRTVLQLSPDRHGRVGMVHELDCSWVNGDKRDPEFRARFREITDRAGIAGFWIAPRRSPVRVRLAPPNPPLGALYADEGR
jgi:hypothetical protein